MSILMVTGMEGARNCAAVVGTQLGKEVEVAEGRKAALAALRRREFAAVVVDETIAECDPAAASNQRVFFFAAGVFTGSVTYCSRCVWFA